LHDLRGPALGASREVNAGAHSNETSRRSPGETYRQELLSREPHAKQNDGGLPLIERFREDRYVFGSLFESVRKFEPAKKVLVVPVTQLLSSLLCSARQTSNYGNSHIQTRSAGRYRP
jgi:hypothetical protein